MTTFTVISQTSRMGLAPLTAHPFAAIPGRPEVWGRDIHVARVDAGDGDEAIAKIRDAIHLVGGVPDVNDMWEPSATRWTVIGQANNDVCPSWATVAVIAGEHEVCGRWESMLSHRWVRVVDADSCREADKAGYLAAAADYQEAWD